MQQTILYLLTVLIWGSTWIAIKMQLGHVPTEWSVTYRFGLAGLLLLAFCIAIKRSLKFSFRQHLRMAIQGIFMFALGYWLFYLGSIYITTGLVAIVFALIVFFNLVNARIFLKTPIEKMVLIGGLLGLFGLIITLWSKLQAIQASEDSVILTLIGAGLVASATLVASWGNIIASSNQRTGLPTIETAAIGMLYGTVFMSIIAFSISGWPTIDLSLKYVSSFLYLTLFGTIVAFLAYLKLIKDMGPSRAAYVFILTPIVALLISTIYEDFSWSPGVFIGIALVITGNMLAIIKR